MRMDNAGNPSSKSHSGTSRYSRKYTFTRNTRSTLSSGRASLVIAAASRAASMPRFSTGCRRCHTARWLGVTMDSRCPSARRSSSRRVWTSARTTAPGTVGYVQRRAEVPACAPAPAPVSAAGSDVVVALAWLAEEEASGGESEAEVGVEVERRLRLDATPRRVSGSAVPPTADSHHSPTTSCPKSGSPRTACPVSLCARCCSSTHLVRPMQNAAQRNTCDARKRQAGRQTNRQAEGTGRSNHVLSAPRKGQQAHTVATAPQARAEPQQKEYNRHTAPQP